MCGSQNEWQLLPCRALLTGIYNQYIMFWVVVPCIWFEIRINYQLDAIEYLFTLARHVSGLHAHLQEQQML